MTNRLADALSPYLRQHADNPVDWREWGPEAFAEARSREVPILLSIGYAACHWCHVMAHESFADEQVAAVLNAGFVSIKVDREERPDVDASYMTATTALTGRGGWPMTCLLTPAGDPFYAGTYFPKAAFLQLLGQVSSLWQQRRADVLASSAQITEQLRAYERAQPPGALGPAELDAAAAALARDFDPVRGGFGGAPKFPPGMALHFLLRQHTRTGDPASLEIVTRTCDAMARGGIFDQLGGGFARYSTDADWVVPHFEKMLYDNAILLRTYAAWSRRDTTPLARRIAAETAGFLLRDLVTEHGGFASALDADTDGVEGLSYVWTPAQLHGALGEDAAPAAAVLGVTEEGTFENGTSTLQLRRDPDDPVWWSHVRERLLAARADRPQPARDDKVVTSWNGLAIAALAVAGRVLGEDRFVAAAGRAAAYLLEAHWIDGRLRRTSLGGRVSAAPGMADDYGNLIEGLIQLYQADGDGRWLARATLIADTAVAVFRDDEGGWRDTPADAERLFLRPATSADNAEPSGLAALAGGLLMLGALTGRTDLLDAAPDLVAANGQLAQSSPRFAGWTLAVAEAAVAGPVQVAVIGDDVTAAAMRTAVARHPAPGAVLAWTSRPAAGDHPAGLLHGRGLVGGRSAAYVCRDFTCQLPVRDVAALEEELANG